MIAYLSIHPFIYPTIHPSIYLSINIHHPSINIHPSVHPSNDSSYLAAQWHSD
jgi:hypothetical protein